VPVIAPTFHGDTTDGWHQTLRKSQPWNRSAIVAKYVRGEAGQARVTQAWKHWFPRSGPRSRTAVVLVAGSARRTNRRREACAMNQGPRYARTADGVHIAYQVHADGPINLVIALGWMANIEALWEVPSQARFLN
jgi:hypothetical protein